MLRAYSSSVSSLMRTLILSCVCVCMGGAASAVHAAVAPDQAELVMKQSGLWDQLGSVLPQARVGFSAAFSLGESEPSNEVADKLNGALERAYGADTLRLLGRSMLSKSLDDKQVAAMRRWFDSPMGRKISDVEKAASTTQTDLRAVIKQGTDVFEHLPAARRELLTQMLKETRADEAMVEVAIHTLLATHKGISRAIPGSSLTNEEVKTTLMKEREAMLTAYKQLILASFAQAYAPLSDQELGQYVGFLKSKAGRRHTQLAYRSLQAALAAGEQRFVKLAPEVMKAIAAAEAAASPP